MAHKTIIIQTIFIFRIAASPFFFKLWQKYVLTAECIMNASLARHKAKKARRNYCGADVAN